MMRLALGGLAAMVLAGAVAAQTPPVQTPPVQPVLALAHASAEPWSDQSYYLPMRDGTRIAISLWFPSGKPPTTKGPVLLVQTRYGRAGIYNHSENGRYNDFRRGGYVVAVVDVRGSTASFG